MKKINQVNPVIKFVFTLLTCASFLYAHYHLFNSFDFVKAVIDDPYLKFGVVFYLGTFLFYLAYYIEQKMTLLLVLWLVFNLAIATNFIVHILGYYPPIWLQYSQSTSLSIYVFFLLISKTNRTNWLRIFSMVCMTVLVPCLYFFFSEIWLLYEYSVYLLCLTPIVKAQIFFTQNKIQRVDVIDEE